MCDLISPCLDISSHVGPPICKALAKVLKRNNRIKQRTKLWYTTRVRMLTCSDMAAVLGENPYSNRQAVFRKKTGQSRPFKGNYATARGTRLEPEAISAYERVSGKTVWHEDIGLLQHPDWPQIGGSPDGITHDGILIEIKCPLTRPIIHGFCPPQYVAQVQVLMEICDLELAHFVQYKPGDIYKKEILDITIMKRDRDYFAKVLPVFLEFMKDITSFYESAHVPIGTPMIDWDEEDRKAKKKLDTAEAIGIGKICAFVRDPITQKQQFVVEEYSGPSNPVIRTVHDLTDDYVSKNELVTKTTDMIETIKAAPATPIELDLEVIMSRLPKSHRPVVAEKQEKEEKEEEEDERPVKRQCRNRINLNTDFILNRMKNFHK